MNLDIEQLEYYHPTLRALMLWDEKETGLGYTITSQYRIDEAGVHGTLPLRGDDLRCRNIIVGTAIVKVINDSWSYDFERPSLQCAVLHGVGPKLHIHLQVHDNTR